MPSRHVKIAFSFVCGALAISGCATPGENSPDATASPSSAQNRLGYVQSKSQATEFKKFDYQFSMDMTTSMTLEREDRQYFNLCKINAGKKVATEAMVEICTLALQNPGISQKSKTASYYNRGLIKLNLERLGEARTDYLAAINSDDNFGDGYLALAGLSMLDGDTPTARRHIESALARKVRHPAYAHYLLGHALENENEFVKARAEYRRALELRPNWRDAQKRIDRINISWSEEN